jgi:hypothetical protein
MYRGYFFEAPIVFIVLFQLLLTGKYILLSVCFSVNPFILLNYIQQHNT